MFVKKNLITIRQLAKSFLNAIHNVMQMLFQNLVIDRSPVPLAGQKSAALHQSQVIRSGGLRELTSFGQLVNGVTFPRHQ